MKSFAEVMVGAVILAVLWAGVSRIPPETGAKGTKAGDDSCAVSPGGG